jgi:hypothetical protein
MSWAKIPGKKIKKPEGKIHKILDELPCSLSDMPEGTKSQVAGIINWTNTCSQSNEFVIYNKP